MNEKYKIIFSLEKSLYRETSPVVIKSGALVSNTEKGKLHIQLKFKNVSDKRITLLKVKTVLMDSIGRELGEIEKQYLDLGENCNDEFGGNVPIFIEENATRKFFAYVTEVCFADGSIWNNENVIWESIPIQKSLQSKLNASEALEEFKIVYCKNAKYIPLKYKDLWICACGNINKETHEKCCSCGAKFSDMESADNETLKKNNIYRNAAVLVNKNVSSEIEKGIALFERIPDWKDSTTKLEEAKQKLILVSQHEKDTQIKNAKQKKKNIIIAALSFVAVVILIIGISIGSSISKANKYEQAQEYMAQHKYSEAMKLFDDLGDYKDADDLYIQASYMYEGDYAGYIKRFQVSVFEIPNNITEIENGCFYGCETLREVIIPNSVISIGEEAFYGCENLTKIAIPNSVTSIGRFAFLGCENLTKIVIPDNVKSMDDQIFVDCWKLIIYCEAKTIPNGWELDWDYKGYNWGRHYHTVHWGYTGN